MWRTQQPSGQLDAGQRTAAELAVGGLTGLRNVKDEIMIDFDADPGNVTLLVEDALDRNALIVDDSEVVVDTAGNTVTLTGHVRTWAEHDAALGAAWMASGVYDVIDNLVITRLTVTDVPPDRGPAMRRSAYPARDAPAWRDRAACRHYDPDLFFPEGTAGPALRQAIAAKQVCQFCPARGPCLRFALRHGLAFGIWGGTDFGRRAG